MLHIVGWDSVPSRRITRRSRRTGRSPILRVDRTVTADASFLAGIRRDPLDLDLRHVYADWLEERGDVRGEYVRLQVERSGLSLDNDPDGRLVPLCDRMMTLRGAIDDRWLAEMEQPSVILGNPTPYDAEWIAPRVPVIRDIDGSFRSFPYADEPDLDLDHGSDVEVPGIVLSISEMEEDIAEFLARHSEIARTLERVGIRLPNDFARASSDWTARRLVQMRTYCTVQLNDDPSPCPLLPHVRILPFDYDSQFCYFVMLYLHPSGGHCVVVSGDRRFLGEEPEADEDWGRVEEHVHFVAPSFETFLHRWRLDHSLWGYSNWLRSQRGESVTRSLLDARPPERPELPPDVQAHADALMARFGSG